VEYSATYVLGMISGILIAYRERLGLTAEMALAEIDELVRQYKDGLDQATKAVKP